MRLPFLTLLLVLTLSGERHRVRGVLLEQVEGCAADGSRTFVRTPMPRRRMLARPGDVNTGAPAAAEVYTDQAGQFDFSLPDGTWCIVEADRRGPCDLVVKVQGGGWDAMQIIRSTSDKVVRCEPPKGPPKHAVRGEALIAVMPCGDEGEPPRPLPRKKILVRTGSNNSTQPTVAQVTTDQNGHFELALPSGTYCLVGEEKHHLAPFTPPDVVTWIDNDCVRRRRWRCDGTVTVGETDVEGVEVRFIRTCGDICVRGDPALPISARGVGRAAAAGGRLHVRGVVKVTASWWSGVPPGPDYYERQRNPPPRPGEMVRVRPSNENRGQAPVAEVVTDEHGRFDVALPPGSYCLTSGWREQYFTPPRKGTPAASVLDLDCVRREYTRCDAVVKLADADVDGVEIRYHQPSPPEQPCRTGPYTGSYPPSAAPPPSVPN